MKINKYSVISFVGSAILFGAAAYRFATTGVTVAPFMFLGLGACAVSLGVILTGGQKKEK